MKELYKIFIVLGSCLAAVSETKAQCTCANGSTPDSVVYTFTLPPTSDFSTSISFPQFDPSIGTLNCITFRSTITAIAELAIRNRDSVARDYEFLYTQSIGFAGPGGLFTNSAIYSTYGPTTLTEYGTPGDSIHYGPDTPFKNKDLIKTISNTSPYLGSGNINISFTNTGSTLLMQGSNNYQATVSTRAYGDFRLSYYWCSAAALANGLKNFYATRKDNKVLLQWTAENELQNTKYEVQLSRDGHGFSALAATAVRTESVNNSHTYEYLYEPENNFRGKLFFRIKQLKPNGQSAYSAIKMIDLLKDGDQDQLVTIYSNPTVKTMAIQFPGAQTGNFRIEVLNSMGQALYSRLHTLSGQSRLEFRMTENALAGIYYLRIKNLQTSQYLVQKIFLR